MGEEALVIRRIRIWLGVAIAALLVAPAVSAVPITLSYSGFIDQLNDPGGLLDPAVTLGAAFTAELTLDPDFVVPIGADANSTYYASGLFPPQPLISVSVSIGGTQLVSEWEGLGIGNNSGISPLSSSIDFWAPGYQLPFNGPAGTVFIGVSFLDSSGLTLDDASFFVPSDTDFTGWDSVRLLMTEPGALCAVDPDCSLAAGTISAVGIPEPTTALLLGLGLVGLSVRRRRLAPDKQKPVHR